MLKLVEIPFTLPSKGRFSPSMGSIFHGALMERIPGEWAERLHAEGLRPYSQYLFYDYRERCCRWRLGFLTEAASSLLLESIGAPGELFLKQKGYAVKLGAPRLVRETDYDALADGIFPRKEAPRGARIDFLTVASFRQGGAYVILPEAALIFQSLQSRWDAFSPKIRLDAPELGRQLAECCRVTAYRLESRPFSVEGQKINGFTGSLRLRFTGNDMTRRLMGLLLSLAPFSGVGIKTALGMGATATRLDYAPQRENAGHVRKDDRPEQENP